MNILKSFGLVVAAGCMFATLSLTSAQAVTLYSVRTGDTPAKIAREHNITLDHLKRANADLRKSEKVHPGQILIIPDQDEMLMPESTSNATYVIHNVAPVASTPSVTTPKKPVATTTTAVAVATPAPAPPPKPATTEVVNPANAASRDTEVIIEAAPTSHDTAEAAPATPTSHDNVVIVDNQIIRIPSYVKPAETTDAAPLPGNGRRSQLASRRGSIIANILMLSRKFIGVPYVWGGTTASGFDCSGFVMRVFAINGIHLPRTADAQYYGGTPVKSPEPGDLVFFSTYLPGPSHVGIYLGSNMFIQASSSRGVTISNLAEAYYHKSYIGARRYI